MCRTERFRNRRVPFVFHRRVPPRHRAPARSSRNAASKRSAIASTVREAGVREDSGHPPARIAESLTPAPFRFGTCNKSWSCLRRNSEDAMTARTIERFSISQIFTYALIALVALALPDRRSGHPRVRHNSPNIVPVASEDGLEPGSANAERDGAERSSEKAVEKGLWPLFKTAALQWVEHKDARLGAALSYYSVFSIGPLILIAVAIAGFVFGREAVQGQVDRVAERPARRERRPGDQRHAGGCEPTARGPGCEPWSDRSLVFAAIGVVVQLKDAFNTVWEIEETPRIGNLGLRAQLCAVASAVLAVGFLLLVSMLMTTFLAVAGKYLGSFLPEVALQAAGFVFSFAMITLLFAMMFKWLPDTEVQWRDVWLGAILTAAMFEIGKFLIGLYIGKQGLESTYGAASSLVVVLILGLLLGANRAPRRRAHQRPRQAKPE